MSAARATVLYRHQRHILMDDTDAAGVIYFGSVFRWHESGMMRWLEALGYPISSLLGKGFAFPCVHSEADYTWPLHVDDVVEMRLLPGRVGRRSFELVSGAYLDATLAVTVRAVYVWAEAPAGSARDFRPAALPLWLREALEAEGASL